MTVRTKLTVNGTEFVDYRTLTVRKTTSKYNTGTSFQANFDSPFGRHADSWTVGQQVAIYADEDAPPTTLLFKGILEKISFSGKENTQTVSLSGRDYVARLLDITVQPVVYTSSEVSTIVKNIMSNNVLDITTTNVNVTTTTIPRIKFNHQSVFDAIQQLAQLSGFYFYVDNNLDLNFKQQEVVATGLTLDNTNILRTVFDQTREGMSNQIWVYGDRFLMASPQEVFPVGSPIAGGTPGSVFTLQFKPFNTQVSTTGSIRKGGVFRQEVTASSGVDYLVNFDDQQIILMSGTTLGYNTIPASGGSVVINYDRQQPVAKFGRDRISMAAFGTKNKVIQDKSIKDPQTASSILESELANANPTNRIDVEINGWLTGLVPGKTVNLVLSDFGLNDATAPIAEVTYDFNPLTIQTENIIKVKIDKRITDLIDSFTDIDQRLKRLENEQLQSTDTLTILEAAIGSLQVVGSKWQTYTRKINDSFVDGHPINGILGNVGSKLLYYTWDTSGTNVLDVISNISGTGVSGPNITGTTYQSWGSSLLLNGSNQYVKLVYPGSYFNGYQWSAGSSILAISGAGSAWGWSINMWVNILGSSLGPSGGGTSTLVGNRFGDNFVWLLSGAGQNGPGSYVLRIQTDDSQTSSPTTPLSGWVNLGLSWKLNSRAADTGSPFYPYAEMYVNGSQVSTGSYLYATGNPGAINTGGSIYFGFEERSARTFNGLIGNVRIHPRFIGSEEHLAVYQNQVSGLQPLLGDRRGPKVFITSGGYTY